MIVGLFGVGRDRLTRALVLIGVGQISVLAFTTQAQARFIYLATVLLAISGIAVLGRALEQLPLAARRIAVVGGFLCLVAQYGNELRHAFDLRERRIAGTPAINIAAAVIRADPRRTQSCSVVATKDATRLAWYSGCRVERFEVDGGPLYDVRYTDCEPNGTECVAVVPGVVGVRRLR
jgi:hypothetical protein